MFNSDEVTLITLYEDNELRITYCPQNGNIGIRKHYGNDKTVHCLVRTNIERKEFFTVDQWLKEL